PRCSGAAGRGGGACTSASACCSSCCGPARSSPASSSCLTAPRPDRSPAMRLDDDPQPEDLGPSDEAPPPPAWSLDLPPEQPSAPAPPQPADGPEPPPSPVRIVEALLFTGGDPLTAAEACAIIRGLTPEQFHQVIDALNHDYRRQGRPYAVVPQGSGH